MAILNRCIDIGNRTLCEIPATTSLLEQGGAESGAPTPADPDLPVLVAAWPDLPEPIRRAVLALVHSAKPAD
jgi:hypothetical protein